MQNFFIPSRSRRRMPKRSSLRPRQRGIFLSSAAQIQRTRRQRRDGESKTGFFGLRILRSACRANRKLDKLTIRPPRNPRGRRHGSWLLFVENHRKKAKPRRRLHCHRHIQKRSKNLRKAQSRSGMCRCKRLRYASCRRVCRRRDLRVLAFCYG